MNATLLRLWCICVCLFFCLAAQAADPDDLHKKEYEKSFPASKSDELFISNKYGGITITHWNKSEVAFRVVVEVKTRNAQDDQKNLDRIQIRLGKEGNVISGITELSNVSVRNGKLDIQYYISMPSWVPCKLEQHYGNILMPSKNPAPCQLTVKYGNIEGGSFEQPLQLEAKYSNVTLGALQSADFDLGYCGKVILESASQLNADTKYSNLKAGEIGSLALDLKYGQLEAEKIQSAETDVKYSTCKIGYLVDNLAAESLDYSTLELDAVNGKFQKIQVEARYSAVKLALPSSASFRVKGENLKYGHCKLLGFEPTKSEKEKDAVYYEVNGGKNGSIYFDAGGYSNMNIRKE